MKQNWVFKFRRDKPTDLHTLMKKKLCPHLNSDTKTIRSKHPTLHNRQYFLSHQHVKKQGASGSEGGGGDDDDSGLV